MPTIRLTPVAEMNIVCDHSAIFPATDFEFYNNETNAAVDMSGYSCDLEVFETNGGPLILEWHSSDNTVTVEGDDSNILRLASKSEETMGGITAKTYSFNLWIYPIGEDRVRYATGRFIVNPV
jgi:hypothetical protein